MTGQFERQIIEARAAFRVAPQIRFLQRVFERRRQSLRLEHGPEQHRPPYDFTPVALRERIDPRRDKIRIGRPEVEKEIDAIRHYFNRSDRILAQSTCLLYTS